MLERQEIKSHTTESGCFIESLFQYQKQSN